MEAENVVFDSLANERGSTIVLVALAITALLSVVALAIDIGMLLTARTSAQRAADAAAMAGAGSLIVAPGDEDRARQVAIDFGGQNYVHGSSVEVLPEDVEVLLDEGLVRVTVHRTADRGNAIGTWFARVFGVDEVDVGARAAAQVLPAGRATCLKPFALFDRFDDEDGDGEFDATDDYDPFVHGYGSSWRNPGAPGDDGLGYIDDFGRQVVLKGGGPKAGPLEGEPGTGPGWYYPWDIPQKGEKVCPGGTGGQGAKCYQWAIENCHPAIIEVDEEHWVETGNMQGPTRKGVENLIEKDSGAYWDEGCNCVKGSKHGETWEASERIGIVPTFDPSREFDPGKKPIYFTNFVAVFFEKVEGNGNNQRVYGRILWPTGIGGGSAVAPALKYVSLVE